MDILIISIIRVIPYIPPESMKRGFKNKVNFIDLEAANLEQNCSIILVFKFRHVNIVLLRVNTVSLFLIVSKIRIHLQVLII